MTQREKRAGKRGREKKIEEKQRPKQTLNWTIQQTTINYTYIVVVRSYRCNSLQKYICALWIRHNIHKHSDRVLCQQQQYINIIKLTHIHTNANEKLYIFVEKKQNQNQVIKREYLYLIFFFSCNVWLCCWLCCESNKPLIVIRS